MEPSRSALWMTQSPPHSQDSELTIHYEAEPSLSNRNVPVFRHCLLLGFLPGTDVFSDQTTLHLPLPHSRRHKRRKWKTDARATQSTAISGTQSVSETGAYKLAQHAGHSSVFLKKRISARKPVLGTALPTSFLLFTELGPVVSHYGTPQPRPK